jgi:hypothetical protein
VRAGAVQIGHFGEHAGRRAEEQPSQGRDWLGRVVRGGTAEMRVIHQERCSQAEQRLDREECDLATGRDLRAVSELAELLPRLTFGQVQEIGELRHTARLLPASSARKIQLIALCIV